MSGRTRRERLAPDAAVADRPVVFLDDMLSSVTKSGQSSPASFSAYDRKAWEQIQKWREPSVGRQLVPAPVKRVAASGLHKLGSGIQAVPGTTAVAAAVEGAVTGLLGTVDRAAVASVHRSAILSRFQKAGHPVEELADIRKLDLRDIDKAKPRLDLRYVLASMGEGAAAGAGMTGGAVLAAGGGVFGIGAGAAPGIGVLVGVTAADAVAVLAASSRVSAEIAAYYGYDVELPHERLRAAGVLGVGLASQAGKAAAYQELNKLVQALARRKTWEALNKNVMTGVIRSVFGRFGVRLTQKKLGQAVPVVGILVGAGLNAATVHGVAEAAEMVYRERFLREKYGLPETDDQPVPQQQGAVECHGDPRGRDRPGCRTGA